MSIDFTSRKQQAERSYIIVTRIFVTSGIAMDRETLTLMFLAACWLSSFEGTRTKALTAAAALAGDWATLDDLS